MARKQYLINYHTSGTTNPSADSVKLGEIVVKHNNEKPELLIKKDNGEFATFVDSNAVDLKVNDVYSSATTAAATSAATLNGLIDAVDDRVDIVSGNLSTFKTNVVETYATKTGVTADISSAKNEAIASAKTYADGLNTAMDERVDALETDSHTHSNKALLDTYAQTEADLKDAVAKKHGHANKDVLDDITAEKVSAWDAAEKNAKDYADGLASNYDDAGAAATVEGKLNAHTADTVAHITAQERTGWNAAKTAIDTFLKDADMTESAVDTLAELQTYMNNDGKAAAELINRVASLESISGQSHTHSNKELLDTYKQTEVDLADAVAKKHNHANKTVLDGISSEQVTAWDAAEQNAKNYAKNYTDGQISAVTENINALDSRIDELEALSGATQSAIQTIAVTGITGVEVVVNGTTRTLDFTDMVIDCGDF